MEIELECTGCPYCMPRETRRDMLQEIAAELVGIISMGCTAAVVAWSGEECFSIHFDTDSSEWHLRIFQRGEGCPEPPVFRT